MKSKTTAIWFVLAISLFAAIWLMEKYLQPGAPAVAGVLPGVRAAEITRLQISPLGQREISVVRSNGGWRLEKPLAYPAQAAAVQALAAVLEKLTPATRLTAADMHAHKDAEQEFGFENPQFTLVISSGENQRQLVVGNKTAPGDQVFLRVVGTDGAFLTDAGWLALLPRSANDWRDTALVNAAGVCDWIVITNGAKALEFRRDATNQLWRMVRPLAARADSSRIAAALQQLRDGRATQFVSDDPRADLGSYGLQPAELAIWLGQNTNLTDGISAGKTLADNPAQIFARREGWNAVVAADKNTFAGWRGAVNEYRDPHLFTLTAPVAEIEVRGEENYTLSQSGSNAWRVAGEKFPADAANVETFVKLLAGLRIAEFVKDVATPADLQGFGLATPGRQIILRGTAGDTNSTLVQVLIGTNDASRVFVKRADEEFVYALKPEDLVRLPEHGWEFRDRAVWHFSENDIAQVTLRQNGKTRVLVRTGENKWSLGAGSQGIINPPAIEETMHRLGELTAAGWVGRNVTAPEKYGLNPGNLSVTVELKTGEKLEVAFGAELPQSQTALAAVTLDGERWAFVFPPVLYQFVVTYLTIPPNSP
jgi:Domain of unknown function (DUF4340)